MVRMVGSLKSTELFAAILTIYTYNTINYIRNEPFAVLSHLLLYVPCQFRITYLIEGLIYSQMVFVSV